MWWYLIYKNCWGGKAFVDDRYNEGFAYKGIKASMIIHEEQIEDREWLSETASSELKQKNIHYKLSNFVVVLF